MCTCPNLHNQMQESIYFLLLYPDPPISSLAHAEQESQPAQLLVPRPATASECLHSCTASRLRGDPPGALEAHSSPEALALVSSCLTVSSISGLLLSFALSSQHTQFMRQSQPSFHLTQPPAHLHLWPDCLLLTTYPLPDRT